jgi:hypothetical protein
MNCIGPTARSQTASPSQRPPSLSGMAATPRPSSGGPVILGLTAPAALNRVGAPPNRPWLDSMRPMPARTVQESRQSGSYPAAQAAASR